MSDALKAATEALALQLEITRDHGSLTWSEADWMLDAHGDDILAALRDREQAIAAERERALREGYVIGREEGYKLNVADFDEAERRGLRGSMDAVLDAHMEAAIRARGASEREGRDA